MTSQSIFVQENFMATRSTTNTTATGSRTSGGAQIVGDDRRTSSDGPGPEVMDAATLIGDSVVNDSGEDLGKIEGIMLDVQSGRIAYAVLSFGGFLGMGDKLFAIPWSALTLDTDQECFILHVPKDRLENAPGFDKDHWPSMADAQWASDLHSYYNATPYWSDASSGIARDTRTTAGTTRKSTTS
jgi:sporulation protein YlmC with PRC-barrel domain